MKDKIEAESSDRSGYLESELGYKVAIEEMRFQLDAQMSSITAIKHSVEVILGTVSLILSLGGLLGIYHRMLDTTLHLAEIILIVVLIICFIVIFVLGILVLQPIKMHRSVEADWNLLYDIFVKHKDSMNIYRQQLSNYLSAIENNHPIIEKRRKWALFVTISFIVLILDHLFLGFIT